MELLLIRFQNKIKHSLYFIKFGIDQFMKVAIDMNLKSLELKVKVPINLVFIGIVIDPILDK